MTLIGHRGQAGKTCPIRRQAYGSSPLVNPAAPRKINLSYPESSHVKQCARNPGGSNQSPLLPDDQGRRVAVYRCSCGEAGCGVIAPVILPSPDGRKVSWVDFRDYTGVFDGPVRAGSGCPDGTPWPFRDLHFDRGRYIAEIRRASADRSWETARRVTAQLVREGLHARAMTLIAPDLALAWVAPAWQEDGVMISFENASSGFTPFAQQVLAVTAGYSDPERAAQDILRQLQAVPVSQWAHRFGWRPPHRSPEP
ncbi:MAG TPA: hypothetical protein VFB06_26845 [Streptosporangiaceae bacterium]|nr:hypothetical protein [Streptosporangiaceae bacterium]